MSEAAHADTGRAEMERSIVQRSLQDEDFRQRLLDDPKELWSRSWGAGYLRASR